MDSNAELQECLELQLTEVEMLEATYCEPGEFTIDESCKEVCRSFIDEKVHDAILQERIGFTLKVSLNGQTVELTFQLPHDYPLHSSPFVFTRLPQASRESQALVNEKLRDFLATMTGELCVASAVQWVQDTAVDLLKQTAKTETSECPTKQVFPFSRLWIYSHHIYSQNKRKDLLNWGRELNLTGFSMPGKPGIVCIEGHTSDTDEYWSRVKRLTWKKIVVREREEATFRSISDLNKERRFGEFEEKSFEARPGHSKHSYHMSFGELKQFLDDHKSGYVFQLYTGVKDGDS